MTTPALDEYYTRCINEGYPYECACGEMYKSIAAAACCRKCRNYCIFGYCTHVTDVRDGKVVAGRKPTREEYDAALAEHELEEARRREEELQEWLREEERVAEAAIWKHFFRYETIAEELGY